MYHLKSYATHYEFQGTMNVLWFVCCLASFDKYRKHHKNSYTFFLDYLVLQVDLQVTCFVCVCPA